MAHLIPYVVFPGTCREALEFYQDIFDGEITSMQTFEESPIDIPEDDKNRIFNADFRADDLHFKASDDLSIHSVSIGTNISLYVLLPDGKSQEKAFEKLSDGGQVLFPIKDSFGMLKDKYQIQWMLVDGSK